MKKIFLFTVVVCALCNLQIFAQVGDDSEKVREIILIKLIFENEEQLYLDMTIPIKDKISNEDRNSLGFVTRVATTHCDDVSPICSYKVTGKAVRINSEQTDVTFDIKFSKKWKKCNARNKFIVSKNFTTKEDLKCDIKISAVFSKEKNE